MAPQSEHRALEDHLVYVSARLDPCISSIEHDDPDASTDIVEFALLDLKLPHETMTSVHIEA